MILATIYKATELYMLQDTSEDYKETWLFLDRRIKDALQLHAILSKSADMPAPDQAVNSATEAATAVFITVNKIRQFPVLCLPRPCALRRYRLICPSVPGAQYTRIELE